MATITCSRCTLDNEQIAAPPLPNELGDRVYDTICEVCWKQWLEHQTAIINHYALNLLEPEARKMLSEQLKQFLFAPPDDG